MHIYSHRKLLNHSLVKVNYSITFSHVLYYCITIKKYRLVAESERKRNSELTILTADMMTCPFVDDAYKQSFLALIGITEIKDQQMIMRFAKKQKYIFTRWTMFNLNKELQAKISQEVYS